MAEYNRTNTGIISKNDRKQSEKHPDITGTINVEGVDYFLDGWQKRRKQDGAPFYSLRVKRKDKRVQEIKDSYSDNPSSGDNADDDELPF